MIPEHGALIGEGNSGQVYEYGEGKVIKIFHRGTDSAHPLYKWCMNNESIYCPRIYEISGHDDGWYIIMEKFLLHTEKTKTYIYMIEKYKLRKLFWLGVELRQKKYIKQLETIYNEIPTIVDWMYGTFNVYKRFHSNVFKDMVIDNIGERPGTGEIVFFDPKI